MSFQSTLAAMIASETELQPLDAPVDRDPHDAPEHPVNPADPLRQRLQQANTWDDLDAVLDEAQQQYREKELSAEAVEQLAVLATERSRQIPPTADGVRLSQLFEETPIRRVDAKVLGEVVVFARDGVEVPADGTGVVYRDSELRRMPGKTPEQVRAIHAAKQAFDGDWIDAPAGEYRIPVEDLLPDKQGEPDACPTCGGSLWWEKQSGQRVCSTCHPQPRR